MMDIAAIMAKVDHTLLKPEATWADIQKICDEAMEYHTASVCINPCFVKQAAEYMKGAVPVCTVIGFPLGATDTATKVFEAKTAIENGASEVDMVINIGRLKAGDVAYVTEEIAAIKKAVGDHVLKVIIETCLLTDAEKETMCQAVIDAGADFIKTSTGFSTGGATFDDVALLRRFSGLDVKVKAAGGIKTLEDAEKFIELGADRLGTSRIVKLAKAMEQQG